MAETAVASTPRLSLQCEAIGADTTTIRQALAHQRAEDNCSDAWTVFNRVQENVLRGNVFVKSLTDKGLRERKARPIASIQEHVRVNQQMFDLVAA